jgi:CRISPR-associated endoribonuclease Cas6
MTPDLLSLVIPIHNPQAASLAFDQGRALAAQFLDWVRGIDVSLSADLHDPDQVPRPYTVSNLFNLPKPKRGRVYVPAGSELWFRITSLSPALSLFLVDQLLPTLPDEVQIGDTVFTLGEPTWQAAAHPWAGWVNYDHLVKQDLLGRAKTKLRFQFASATAFKTHGLHMPYVTPELTIPSWLRSWNAFAPVRFPESLLEGLPGKIGVSYYKMQSVPVHYGKATLVGGIGHCSFTILDKDPYCRHVVNVLSAFAFYAGTGVKTALGLGQTRRLGDDGFRGLDGGHRRQ